LEGISNATGGSTSGSWSGSKGEEELVAAVQARIAEIAESLCNCCFLFGSPASLAAWATPWLPATGLPHGE
ncbi:hypothetical protein CLOP_g13677, partial [Closterium sp. NIES-67]